MLKSLQNCARPSILILTVILLRLRVKITVERTFLLSFQPKTNFLLHELGLNKFEPIVGFKWSLLRTFNHKNYEILDNQSVLLSPFFLP